MPFSLPAFMHRRKRALPPAQNKAPHTGAQAATPKPHTALPGSSPSARLYQNIIRMPEDVLHQVVDLLDDRTLCNLTQAASFQSAPHLIYALGTGCKNRYYQKAPDARRALASAHPVWVPQSPTHTPADWMRTFNRQVQCKERITYVHQSRDNKRGDLSFRYLNRNECAFALAFSEMTDAFVPFMLSSLPSHHHPQSPTHYLATSATSPKQRAGRAQMLLALSGPALQASYMGKLLTGITLAWQQRPNEALPYLLSGYALGETVQFGMNQNQEAALCTSVYRLVGDEQALTMLREAAYTTGSLALYDAFCERLHALPPRPQGIKARLYGLQSEQLIALTTAGHTTLLQTALSRYSGRLKTEDLNIALGYKPAHKDPNNETAKRTQACLSLIAQALQQARQAIRVPVETAVTTAQT